MPDNLEATQTIIHSNLIDEVNRTSSLLSDHIREINSAARWYSTLVLGVLAVVIKFKENINDLEGIVWFLVIGNYIPSIIFFIVSFLLFIYTMSMMIDYRLTLENRLSKIKEKILNIEIIKANEVQSLFLEIRETNATTSKIFNPMFSLKLGLISFGAGSFLIINYFIFA